MAVWQAPGGIDALHALVLSSCRSGSSLALRGILPMLLAVVGVQNYSCDPTTGNWTHLGWVVKATELRTGQPAGTVPAGGTCARLKGLVAVCVCRSAGRVRSCRLLPERAALRAPACCAGYGMTILGSGNTHLPLLFATDPKNGSVLGSLVSIREATTTEMPR